MNIASDPRMVVLTTEPPPARFNGERSLTQALVNAYYQGDVDAIRRIAGQVEQRLAALERPREAS